MLGAAGRRPSMRASKTGSKFGFPVMRNDVLRPVCTSLACYAQQALRAWSLVERGVELDIVPMVREFGLGLMPWSPLGGGLLTSKYSREKLKYAGEGATVPNAADASQGAAR